MDVSTSNAIWDALQLHLQVLRIVGGADGRRDADEMDAICRRLGADFWQGLKTGTRVAIDEGVFQGLTGTVLGIGAEHDVIVLIELMDRLETIELDPAAVHVRSAAV